jgi:hypothetical protein
MHGAEALIRSSDLSLPVSKATLIEALVPRIGFSSYPWMARGLPMGASRFGGPADLPANVDWPRVDGRPLLLMAQLNFHDLHIERDHPVVKRLPKRGWLCLFLDMHGYARGMAGDEPGVVALQFEADADRLIRHDPEPPPDTETWTHCHAVTVHPADHQLSLPDSDDVNSPLPQGAIEEIRNAYFDLRCEIDDLARTRHEVTLLSSPTLFNPDLRRSLHDPNEWMLLLQFDGDCSWLAGVCCTTGYLGQPSFGSADFVQYFVRRADYEAGRLNRGFLDYMLS